MHAPFKLSGKLLEVAERKELKKTVCGHPYPSQLDDSNPALIKLYQYWLFKRSNSQRWRT